MGKDTPPMRGTILRGLFEFTNGDFKEYYKLLDKIAADFYFPDRSKLTEELHRAYNQSANGTTHHPKEIDPKSLIWATKRNYKRWLLVFIGNKYNIPAHYFPNVNEVLDPIDMKPPRAQAYDLTKNADQAHNVVVNEHYANLQSELLVFDDLRHEQNQVARHLQNYLKARAKCYEKIVDVAAKGQNDFQYIRILSLPGDFEFIGKQEYDILKAAIDYTSLPSFKHICDYLKLRQDWKGNDKPSGFFIPARSIACQHFALLNQGQTIITEAGVFDKLKSFQPMWLYTESPVLEDQVKYKNYKNLVLSLVDEPETLELTDLELVEICTGMLVETSETSSELEKLHALERRKTLKQAQIRQQKLDYVRSVI